MTQRNSSAFRFIIGVCPVVETPFRRSGESDSAALGDLVGHLGSIGVEAIMYAGFASEMHKLAEVERDELTRLVIERGHSHGMTVVASVSDASTQTATARATRYAEWGADMINILAPSAAASRTRSSLRHVATILAAVDPMPAILQLAPPQLGSSLDAGSVALLAASAPNLVQIKVETRPPGTLITSLRDHAAHLTCLVGSGGVDLPDAVRHGAVGVQPGCSAAELYLKLWSLWSAGDSKAADALHRRMHPYLAYWMQDVELIVAAEKRISFLRGLIPSDVCRAPARVLTSEELAIVDRFLTEFNAELGPAHHSANEPSS